LDSIHQKRPNEFGQRGVFMEISDLEIFYVTAKEGSISKAARKLNYVQSNVTSRIKHLERQLKTQLFYRHSKGVTLTPKGKILLQYAERIFDLIEETKEAVMKTNTLMGRFKSELLNPWRFRGCRVQSPVFPKSILMST
jgi:molybdenum-dependent DNA-binding transcriptional regulator ModE